MDEQKERSDDAEWDARSSFECLADDSVVEVMKRLSVRDALSLATTKKRLHALLENCTELWRIFTFRDFGVASGSKRLYKFIHTHTFVATLTNKDVTLNGFSSVRTEPRGVRQSNDAKQTWRFATAGKREDCVELDFTLTELPKKMEIELEKTLSSCDARHSWPSSYLCSMCLTINGSVVKVFNLRLQNNGIKIGKIAVYPNYLNLGSNTMTLRHVLNSSCHCSLKEIKLSPA